jgi:hypothetical protein
MTKKIKPLRKAILFTHKEDNKNSPVDRQVPLELGAVPFDLEKEPKKISENHTKWEVRVKGYGIVYLVEGVDFEFIQP